MNNKCNQGCQAGFVTANSNWDLGGNFCIFNIDVFSVNFVIIAEVLIHEIHNLFISVLTTFTNHHIDNSIIECMIKHIDCHRF